MVRIVRERGDVGPLYVFVDSEKGEWKKQRKGW